jgi:hypothetical protein
MQSKQVIASASRSIVNYQLTCGFSASVLPSGCIERGQDAALPGAPAAVLQGARGLRELFSAARAFGGLKKYAGFDSPRGF